MSGEAKADQTRDRHVFQMPHEQVTPEDPVRAV